MSLSALICRRTAVMPPRQTGRAFCQETEGLRKRIELTALGVMGIGTLGGMIAFLVFRMQEHKKQLEQLEASAKAAGVNVPRR
mmetsp:Transcript_17866/g.27616  ORF Transcript_17866/g.27616 Transcript_17866/m.27616 type:complete len:83 (-) Transcript_17866:30-278(-)